MEGFFLLFLHKLVPISSNEESYFDLLQEVKSIILEKPKTDKQYR